MDLCNKLMEYEYLTSQYLKGILYPKEFIDLCGYFTSLKVDETSSDLTEVMLKIQKKIVSKIGILKESILKTYYTGDNDDLFALIEEAYSKSKEQELLYDLAVKEQFSQATLELETSSYLYTTNEELANAVGKASLENESLKKMDQTHFDLRINTSSLESILNSYERRKSFSTKPYYTGYSKEYLMYLNDLYDKLSNVISDPILSMDIYSALNEIFNSVPKDDLNPYQLDKCKNLIDVLMNPEDYYNKCIKEEIESPEVANSFFKVYPSYMEMYLDLYLDKYNDMGQQQKINFRKCFGLVENQGELVSMCSTTFSNPT